MRSSTRRGERIKRRRTATNRTARIRRARGTAAGLAPTTPHGPRATGTEPIRDSLPVHPPITIRPSILLLAFRGRRISIGRSGADRNAASRCHGRNKIRFATHLMRGRIPFLFLFFFLAVICLMLSIILDLYRAVEIGDAASDLTFGFSNGNSPFVLL